MVVLLYPYAINHVERLMLSINSRAGITFLLRVIPKRTIPFKSQVQLSCLHLSLLQAEEVCVQSLKRFLETFCHASTQTINVPRHEFLAHWKEI